MKAAVLVISDSAFAGGRQDRSGREILRLLSRWSVEVACYEVLPDDEERISARLAELVDREGVRVVLTTGGTGLGPRDRTPEATRRILHREVPGMAEAMRSHGRERTPFAMLSRGVVGVRGNSLILNLPGSPQGAVESLEAVLPALFHALSMLEGGGHPEP